MHSEKSHVLCGVSRWPFEVEAETNPIPWELGDLWAKWLGKT